MKLVDGLFLISSHLKYSIFHRVKTNDIPLLQKKKKINDHQIKQEESIKKCSVLLDENLTWKPHIKYIENRITKNFGLLFKTKPFLNKQSLLSLCYS